MSQGHVIHTEKQLADKKVYCGELPLQNGVRGCGSMNWRVLWNSTLDRDAGERLLICQSCGAECFAQFH